MNYSDLFKRAFLLISSPAKAWEEIRVEKDRQSILTNFVYPWIGLCGICVFLGSFFGGEVTPQTFQNALTETCAIFVALFGGYFLSSYVINKVGAEKFGLNDNLSVIQQFVGYAFIVPFLFTLLTGIFPGFFIIGIIFQFYLLYIVWEGSDIFLEVEEKSRMSFSITASLILIGTPLLLNFVFSKIMVILN